MKTTHFIIVMMLVFLFSTSAFATTFWEYPSPLTVVETITDIGLGEYRYEYSFTNTDTSPIWLFGVYTTFSAEAENTFDNHSFPEWVGPYYNSMYPDILDNGSYLDASIIGLVLTGNEAGARGNPVYSIQANEFVSGFSFTSSVYNSFPKYYFYSTIESGDPEYNGTGNVAAIGTTIPEPCNLLLFTLGGIWLKKRVRRR